MHKDYIHEYATLETSHWWFTVRQKIILQSIQKAIPGKANLKILNIGVASGASSKWLAVLGDVSSVENEPLFLDFLSAGNFPAIAASIEALPFENESFDLVCAFDVIEHVEDDQAALAEMFRVCKTTGTVCITVPAYKSLWGTHDIVNDHKRRYRMNELNKLMLRNNGVTIFASYFNTILFAPIFLVRKLALFIGTRHKKQTADFSYFSGADLMNKLLKAVLIILLGITDLFLAAQLNIPVTVIGAKSFAEVERLINRNLTPFPLPTLTSIEENSFNSLDSSGLTGSVLPFRKKIGRNDYYITPGNLSAQEIFYISPERQEVFKNPLIFFSDSASGGTIKVRKFSANEIACETYSSFPGSITYLQNNYPGWKAFVDGKQVAISKTLQTFMKVNVAEGRHVVAFKYAPTLIIYTWLVSIAGLIALLFFLLFRQLFPGDRNQRNSERKFKPLE